MDLLIQGSATQLLQRLGSAAGQHELTILLPTLLLSDSLSVFVQGVIWQ